MYSELNWCAIEQTGFETDDRMAGSGGKFPRVRLYVSEKVMKNTGFVMLIPDRCIEA